jgi:hypothetical protein
MRRPAAIAALLALAALGASGCQSTQDKAAALRAQGQEAIETRTVKVGAENKDVDVAGTHVLQDANGTAVVLELKNTGKDRLADVPILIDVKGADGASLYRNDIDGLEPSLQQYAVLRPGRGAVWVNDVVTAASEPKSVDAEIGKGEVLQQAEPRVTLQNRELREDPDGTSLTGFVANKSDIEQKDLVIFAVGYRDGKVVAAGRGQVPRVKPQARSRFNIFFIGNPKGARIELDVPPTVTS